MIAPISLSQVPCLGTAKSYYDNDNSTPTFFDTKTKIILKATLFFAVAGLVFLPFLPYTASISLASAGLGISIVCLLKIGEEISALFGDPSKLKQIERLNAAKELAREISISSELQQELQDIIPIIDEGREDARIRSIQYSEIDFLGVGTATFTLISAPNLQFTLGRPGQRNSLICAESKLVRPYENRVYAKMVCDSERYNALFIPSIKPIYLKIGQFQRSLLVEQMVESSALVHGLHEEGVRQMVRFLLKTGGGSTVFMTPFPFTPIASGKLCIRNFAHLSENPHPDPRTRNLQEEELVLGRENSLLAALHNTTEDLTDIALEEFSRLRPDSTLLHPLSLLAHNEVSRRQNLAI